MITCFLVNNRCYKTNDKLIPSGVCVHSTGANNPYLRRYVQPDYDNPERMHLINILGFNKNGNDWNRININACVHAFIGKDGNNKVNAVQTLPLTCRSWHAGSGKIGSLNNTHLSFEICEDGLNDEAYFNEVMKEAQRLCSVWCKEFNLNPHKDGVILCHQEGYQRGLASNHGDIIHWLKKFNKDMDWFREEVCKMFDIEDEDLDKYQGPASWAKDAWNWGKEVGITDGTYPARPCTRQEVITMLHRFNQIKED